MVAAKRAVADAAVTVSVAPLLSEVAESRWEAVETVELLMIVIPLDSLWLLVSRTSAFLRLILSIE